MCLGPCSERQLGEETNTHALGPEHLHIGRVSLGRVAMTALFRWQPSSHPAASQLASQAAIQPAGQTASRPASRPDGEQPSQPASWPVGWLPSLAAWLATVVLN